MFLLLGFGNPLRTDDGVGQVVAEKLADDPQYSHVQTIACHQLLPEHAEAISEAERVVFVDADAGPQPGQISVREIAPDVADSNGLIHDFTPPTILAYAQLLYGRAPAAVLITISGFSFAHGEELSPPMKGVLPDLFILVRNQLKTENL